MLSKFHFFSSKIHKIAPKIPRLLHALSFFPLVKSQNKLQKSTKSICAFKSTFILHIPMFIVDLLKFKRSEKIFWNTYINTATAKNILRARSPFKILMNEFCIIKSIKSKIDAPVIAQDNILASKQSELYLYWTGKNEESIVQHTDSDIFKISNLCIKP